MCEPKQGVILWFIIIQGVSPLLPFNWNREIRQEVFISQRFPKGAPHREHLYVCTASKDW